MREYTIQIITSIILLGGILVFILLTWLTNIGDSRPFNPDWVTEVRKATRGKAKQVQHVPLLVRTIAKKAPGYKDLVRRRFAQINEKAGPIYRSYLDRNNRSPYFLDSAGVVRAISTNIRQLQPRDLRPYLDFIDGTVGWRLEVRG